MKFLEISGCITQRKFNPLRTTRILFYLRPQFVPRGKHKPSWL